MKITVCKVTGTLLLEDELELLELDEELLELEEALLLDELELEEAEEVTSGKMLEIALDEAATQLARNNELKLNARIGKVFFINFPFKKT
jgi:hypothetical protein